MGLSPSKIYQTYKRESSKQRPSLFCHLEKSTYFPLSLPSASPREFWL